MTGQDEILKIVGLKKTYPNGVKALKGVSFNVKKGEFLVIIGLSGSGKSTLLRCLNRLNDPDSDTVMMDYAGVNYAAPEIGGDQIRWLRGKIGMVFQHFNLVERHSVLSNVLMGALTRNGLFRSLFGLWSDEEKKRALDLLDLVGIRDKAYIRAGQLSGGQKQRVAIARALNQNPEVLLADEPVASLDPATCHTVMDYLQKVNRELGVTIICNLHFLSLVRQYATRVIALKAGEVIYDGSPQNINDEWFKKIFGESAKDVQIR
jgi:phosphonate transport system ATP-binding protein